MKEKKRRLPPCSSIGLSLSVQEAATRREARFCREGAASICREKRRKERDANRDEQTISVSGKEREVKHFSLSVPIEEEEENGAHSRAPLVTPRGGVVVDPCLHAEIEIDPEKGHQILVEILGRLGRRRRPRRRLGDRRRRGLRASIRRRLPAAHLRACVCDLLVSVIRRGEVLDLFVLESSSDEKRKGSERTIERERQRRSSSLNLSSTPSLSTQKTTQAGSPSPSSRPPRHSSARGPRKSASRVSPRPGRLPSTGKRGPIWSRLAPCRRRCSCCFRAKESLVRSPREAMFPSTTPTAC